MGYLIQMFIYCTKPSVIEQQQRLMEAKQRAYSYPEVGDSIRISSLGIRSKYKIDRYRCLLGYGETIYERAQQGLSQWIHFDLGWVQIDSPPPTEGLTVPVIIRTIGVWTLNFTRVVYRYNTEDEVVQKWGFAYGTLDWHAEHGEELFSLEYDTKTKQVYYQIVAFSRPQHVLSWLGYPVVRHFQKRFGVQSMRRMQRWVNEDCTEA